MRDPNKTLIWWESVRSMFMSILGSLLSRHSSEIYNQDIINNHTDWFNRVFLVGAQNFNLIKIII